MIDSQDEQSLDHPSNGDIIDQPKDERRLPVLRHSPFLQQEEKSRRLWPWFLGMVAALVSVVLIFWQPWVAGPAIVATEMVQLAPVTRVLAVNGRIAAVQSVDVRALVSGPLVSLSVAEGASVRAGDELARIDPASQQAVLRQAVAGLDAALVMQAQAQATFARTEGLGANVSRAALDTAASAVQSAMQEVIRTTAADPPGKPPHPRADYRDDPCLER